jgi:hypothetical protein
MKAQTPDGVKLQIIDLKNLEDEPYTPELFNHLKERVRSYSNVIEQNNTNFAKLKSCATTANYNQRLTLLYWKRKYKHWPKFLIPKNVIELRERLKENIKTLDTWGAHA